MSMEFPSLTLPMTKRNWIIVGITTFLMGFWLSLFQEINIDDETWFLQVVRRVLDGEVLYRDIYFGATPLSVYMTTFFGSIFGSELWVSRFVLVLYFVAGILLACAILRELGISSRFSILFILSFFVFAHFQVTWGFSGYNGLAKVFFLSCFLAFLKWSKTLSIQSLVLSAAFAGLCFCSKQNVGLIALIALFLAVVFVCRNKSLKVQEAFKKNAFVLMVFLTAASWVLLPTILQGGWSNFIDYAWLNKKRYLDAEHCSYFLRLSQFDSYSLLIFCAPALILVGFFLIQFRLQKEERLPWVILCIFLGGASFNLYPRPDNFQKMTYIPFVLIFIAYCYTHAKVLLRDRWVRYLRNLIVVWFCTTMISSMILPIWSLITNRVTFSYLPHFSYIFMDEAAYRHWKVVKKQFSSLKIGNKCFFLSTHGGFYYLLFEKKNPTPFDYPIHTALGCHGEDFIVKQIHTHHIHPVIMDHLSWSNWPYMPSDRHPLFVEAFIKDHLRETEVSKELEQIFKFYH